MDKVDVSSIMFPMCRNFVVFLVLFPLSVHFWEFFGALMDKVDISSNMFPMCRIFVIVFLILFPYCVHFREFFRGLDGQSRRFKYHYGKAKSGVYLD